MFNIALHFQWCFEVLDLPGVKFESIPRSFASFFNADNFACSASNLDPEPEVDICECFVDSFVGCNFSATVFSSCKCCLLVSGLIVSFSACAQTEKKTSGKR